MLLGSPKPQSGGYDQSCTQRKIGASPAANKWFQGTPPASAPLNQALYFRSKMRVFDKLESSIIQRIVEGRGYSRNLINLLDSKNNLQGIRVKLNKNDNTLTYLFEREEDPSQLDGILTIVEEQEQLSEFIIRHVVLIEYLEKHDYITIYERLSKTDGLWEFGAGAVNKPFVDVEFNDPQIIQLLGKYIDKEILPSPALKQLYKNGFKTDDEIRFKKQNVSAWAAIILSAILGACGIVNNQASNKSQDGKFDKQLAHNSESTEKVIEVLNNLVATQDCINKTNKASITEFEKIIESLKSEVQDLRDAIKSQKIQQIKNVQIVFPVGENKI